MFTHVLSTYSAMKAALCFAVCLLLMVGLEAEASSLTAPMFKNKILHGPWATSQECTELYEAVNGISNEWPSAIDQSCISALSGAETDFEFVYIRCSCVCQSEYNLFVDCYGQGPTDDVYENVCGTGGFNSGSTCSTGPTGATGATGTVNSAGSTAIYISLLVTAAFPAVIATVFWFCWVVKDQLQRIRRLLFFRFCFEYYYNYRSLYAITKDVVETDRNYTGIDCKDVWELVHVDTIDYADGCI